MGKCKTKDICMFTVGGYPESRITVNFGGGKGFDYTQTRSGMRLTCKNIVLIIPEEDFDKYFEVVRD